jgi:aspartate carbamoyltransferase regulatory subunit
LGYIDPNVTVNVIRDEQLVEKKRLSLPERVVNVIRCKNPRCITQIEQEIEHVFFLADREKGTYRCLYCETAHKPEDQPDFS